MSSNKQKNKKGPIEKPTQPSCTDNEKEKRKTPHLKKWRKKWRKNEEKMKKKW
jgi:hypothetical protein